MTVGDIRKMDLPDDVEIQINSVFDTEHNDLKPVDCDGFYHEKDNKVYLTPSIIAM